MVPVDPAQPQGKIREELLLLNVGEEHGLPQACLSMAAISLVLS